MPCQNSDCHNSDRHPVYQGVTASGMSVPGVTAPACQPGLQSWGRIWTGISDYVLVSKFGEDMCNGSSSPFRPQGQRTTVKTSTGCVIVAADAIMMQYCSVIVTYGQCMRGRRLDRLLYRGTDSIRTGLNRSTFPAKDCIYTLTLAGTFIFSSEYLVQL